MRIAILVFPSLVLLACSSTPTPIPERVQLVTAAQKDGHCKSLGAFTVVQRGGPDKQMAVLIKGMGEVTKRGGNGLYVVSTSIDVEDGATMNGEALQCLFEK
ncbi:hypothetical protein DSM104443_00297 [Usitatibacter rugosus]|uniref:Lipoprotein n=1 Tax=Usitatibacter rugosus TaxID=2732067 RepID=A0A6M4GPK9_9PROT|nr:hypothetical protein [Usitatibacter rugosus]QJR09260.1 hypothetical protein DSM104443_00297 [Usitatibacter rugosus]